MKERTPREADRVMLDVNQSLSATVAPMAKEVAGGRVSNGIE